MSIQELTEESVLLKLTEHITVASEVNTRTGVFKKLGYAPLADLFFTTVLNPVIDDVSINEVYPRKDLKKALAFYNTYEVLDAN